MPEELKDLKCRAYDLFATIETCQFELKKVNQRIVELLTAAATAANSSSPAPGSKSGNTDA